MGGAVSGASVAIPVIVFVKKHSKNSWCDAVPTTQTLHAGSKRLFAFLVSTCTASALALLSQTTVYDTCGSVTPGVSKAYGSQALNLRDALQAAGVDRQDTAQQSTRLARGQAKEAKR